MIEFIKNTYPELNLDIELVEELQIRTRVLDVNEGHTFLHPVQSLEYVYFIKEGVVRSCFTKNQIELTNWFYTKGDIMFLPESFYLEKPSGFFWEATCNSQIIEIKKKISSTFLKNLQISLH